VDADGRVVIQLRKVYDLPGNDEPTAFMGLVVEADGPVRQAFWRDYVPLRGRHVALSSSTVAPGKSGWVVDDYDSGQSSRMVAFGGDDTLLRPPIIYDRLSSHPEFGAIWVGPHFYIEGTKTKDHVYRWDGTYMGVSQVGPSVHSLPQWIGPTLLFAYQESPQYHLLRWTEHDGTRVLVGFDDNSKAAGNPGSDGIDLVWVQGEGRKPDEKVFPERWIMTSKFSTDPAKIKPRRLVRWPPTIIGTPSGVLPPPVGCGYAVYRYFGGSGSPPETGLLIVRLADGVSWKLISNSTSPPDAWSMPIAVTCDEVFSRYKGGYLESIRRVRLDSLGPGIPPPPQ